MTSMSDVNNLALSNAIEAAKRILDAPFGAHCLLIYSNLSKCRKFYTYYIQEILKKDDEIVELDPFYETEDMVRNTLTRHNHKVLDLERFEDSENRLFIIDSLIKNFTKDDTLQNYALNKRLVDIAKGLDKRGATVIEDMGVFNYKYKIKDLLEYEMSMPTYFEFELKCICLYHDKDFDILPDNVRQNLIDHHKIVLRIV